MKFIWNNSYLYCGCRWRWRVIIAVNFQFKQLERRSLKKSGLQRDSNLWPPRIPVRCSTNWAMKPHIGSEVNLLSSYLPVQWNKLTSLPMCGFIAQLVEHRTGIPLKPWFFQTSSFQLLKLEIYCDDHSSPFVFKNIIKFKFLWIAKGVFPVGNIFLLHVIYKMRDLRII